ncbi:PLP-dependent transferase [Bradyrhizobium manausense]|uniref:PLP-dependent transferase n=1 Tax=Bradyrhizobium manausense TaxID=989370 RepID=UPI001BA99953|nr:PLP-dependent transferase [Bradyrhizobium manausense]MBR0725559.1 PLP-dependent transferase [Bradyrhizobium manausense]MBR0834219.1 PLP-dependent transferase [Bradyrhizobium manausense]
MNKHEPAASVAAVDRNLIAASTSLFAPMEAVPFNAASPPIFQTSLFTFDSYAAIEDVFAGRSEDFIYSRGNNPTVTEFERLIATLEGAEAARGFSSGTGAITAALLAFIEAGDRIVAVRNVYNDVYCLFNKLLARFGVTVDYVDAGEPAKVAAVLPGAKLLYLENPTSMVFEVQDVAALAALARRHGVITMIDNSWATPLFQKPILLGVDLVIHAASKYLGGHSDTVAGVIAGSKEHIARINRMTYPYLGAKLSPFEAWLLLRGMRTLPLRMAQHMKSGLVLAERLRDHPAIARVRHPAFLDHPGKASLTGYAGLFAFDVSEAVDVPAFADALTHIRLGVSWGGPETLIVPAQAPLRLPEESNSFARFGVGDRTIRFAVGLEDPDMLWRDLDQALERSRR